MEQSQLEKDVLKLDTYVALHSFSAQESHDLEMRLVYMHLHTHITLRGQGTFNLFHFLFLIIVITLFNDHF